MKCLLMNFIGNSKRIFKRTSNLIGWYTSRGARALSFIETSGILLTLENMENIFKNVSGLFIFCSSKTLDPSKSSIL